MNVKTAVSIVLALVVAFSVSNVKVDAAPSTVLVLNSNDTGFGSFRKAIELANNNPSISRVIFLGNVSTVVLSQTVEYTGSQDLTIHGTGATLDGTNTVDAVFLATGGGDLSVLNLTVRNGQEEGIEVQVPATATGTIHVSLFNVEIRNNNGHGVLVNDQFDPSAPEPPAVPPPAGSNASVDVSVMGTVFKDNGFGALDRDGLRVNEGGLGNLTFTARLSESRDNGADGIELDERGDGDVRIDMFGCRLNDNGSLDASDFDDGFDIDEAGNGSILGKVVFTSASNNFEEGLDFNENNLGDLRVDLLDVEANGNREEGIDFAID